MDGLPIVFSRPLTRIPSPTSIQFTLNTGKVINPICVTLAPANEENEMNTCKSIQSYFGTL